MFGYNDENDLWPDQKSSAKGSKGDKDDKYAEGFKCPESFDYGELRNKYCCEVNDVEFCCDDKYFPGPG